VFERKILRKIFGPTKEANGTWRIKTNKELDELIKHRNTINCVKAQRLSWFGHINRMPETSVLKRIHKWKPSTGRPAARLKSRWEGDVRNDLKKMKRMKWAEQVQDCLKREGIVEKAKTLSEFISVINQLDAQNVCFTISLFHAYTCFENMCSSSGDQNCSIWYHHAYRCDDIRGCVMQF